MSTTSWLARLAAARAPDAAWAYRPGEPSRVEPTAYALFAHVAAGTPPPAPALDWLIAGQRPDGSWGGGDAPDGLWVTALALHALAALDVAPAARARATRWLLDVRSHAGAPREDASAPGPDSSLVAFPWARDGFAWVEPTAHALLALRAVGYRGERRGAAVRFLTDRRCRAGGWNHGVTAVRDIELEPYPYTTAVALAALAPSDDAAVARDLTVLSSFLALPLGAFDLAWVAIALDTCHADPAPALAALAALPEGVWREHGHALALAALAVALPSGTNPFRVPA